MAMTIEELQVLITAETKGLRKELSSVKALMNGAHREVEKATSGISSSLKKLGVLVAGAFAVSKVVQFGKASVTAASQLEGAMLGLRSILEGQGKSFGQANKFIQEYINDGLVPLGDAVTAYKNLASRGYDDKQIQQVMERLKDAAAFGRQSSYSLGAAVASAAEGLKSENSILVDNAGVTKNVAKMWDDYAKSIGKNAQQLTQQEKIQAEVSGIMEETRFQVGDAARYTETYAGKIAALSKTMQDVRVNIGQAFIPILNVVVPILQTMANHLSRVTALAAQLSQALFGKSSIGQVKDTTAQADAVGGLGDAYEKTGKKAKGAVAVFDQVNFVGGTSGADASGGPDAAGAGLVDPSASKDIEGLSEKMKTLADSIKGFFGSINMQPMIDGFNNLRTAIEPFTEAFFSGLKWLWDNILVPFGTWTIENLIPAFLGLITGALSVLNPILIAFQPLAMFLWDNFLQPIASWTGGVVVSVLEEIGTALQTIGNWMSEHQTTVTLITTALVGFFAAWKVVGLLAFIQVSGSVTAALGLMTAALWTNTGAKVASAAQTIILTALYAKDFVVAIASVITNLGRKAAAWLIVTANMLANKVALLAINAVIVGKFIVSLAKATAALVLNAAKWVASTAAMIANKIATVASTIAQIALTVAVVAWNVAAGVGAAVTTAFGVAVAILTSPITLVIAAIALLVTGIVLLVKNWDTVKETAANVWSGIKDVWSAASDWMMDTVIKPIANMYTGLWNGIIDGMNALIRGLNKLSIDVPDWVAALAGLKGGKFGFNIPTIPNIPKLDVGTNYVARDGLAYLHQGEAVVPKQYNPAMGGGDNKEVVRMLERVERAVKDIKNIQAVISANEVTRAAINGINGDYRRTGRNPLTT